MVISILILIIILCLAAGQINPSIVCNSISCKWNKRCRCVRREIAVYDNTVAGLCLYHTDSMKDRVLEPMRKARLLERHEHDIYITDMLAKKEEEAKDEELLKNPNAFAKWMKKNGV